jgi:hypothetical protein
LGAACRGSIWEEEVREVLGKHIGDRGGERVRTIHRRLVVDAVGDDLARGDSLEVDLVVRRYHAESLLDTQVKGAVHAPGDMPAKGAEATRQ